MVLPRLLNTNDARASDVRWFGAVGDGVTDDTGAIVDALAASLRVHFPAGTYMIDSGSLPLTLRTGSTLTGDGPERSIIQLTGSASTNLLNAANIERVTVSDLGFLGVGTATSDGDGRALQVTGSTTGTVSGFVVERCRFEDFGGDYWLDFYQSTVAGTVEHITVRDCEFVSVSGNCRVPGSTAGAGVNIGLRGPAGASGAVRRVLVSGCDSEATHIKGLLWAYNNTEDVTVTACVVRNAGASGAFSNDAGCYALMAYNSTPTYVDPKRVRFAGNTITAPRSCGVYAAGPDSIEVTGNTITGQYDPVGTTLPKGAVVLNGAKRAVVAQNTLLDNLFGVWVVTRSGAVCSAMVTDNEIVSSSNWTAPSGAAGVVVAPSTTATQYGDVSVVDNRIHVTGTDVRSIFVSCKSTEAMRSLRIEDNDLRATYNCVNVYSSDSSSPNIGQVIVRGNSLYSTGANALLMPVMQSSAIRIEDNDFIGGWDTTSAYVCDVNESHGLTLRGNVFRNFSTGTGKVLNTTNSRGSVSGNTFVTVADARRYVYSGGEVLGVDAPTWASSAGTVVESVAAEEWRGWTYTASGWMLIAAVGELAPGSTTLGADQWHIQYQRLQLTGTQRLTLAGTARYCITDL